MFLDRLTQLLNTAFRPRPKYITVSPAGGSGAVAALPPAAMPRHVAIIMDGNGRWAKLRNLPRSAGHAAGTEALREIIRASDDWGIEALSLYAFSTENWARSKEEVEDLMGLLLRYFASEIDELDAKNVRITILGDVDGLPGPQREAVVNAMDRTRNNDGLKLNIAINYGGRAELTRAARILAAQVRDGVIDPEDITEDVFAEELYTSGSPDVDLLIRTSGEMRTSNFLPWQLTYAEFIFDNTYWPDFNRERYMKCLRDYAGRERRFGKEEAEPAAQESASAAEDGRDEAAPEAIPLAGPGEAPAAPEPDVAPEKDIPDEFPPEDIPDELSPEVEPEAEAVPEEAPESSIGEEIAVDPKPEAESVIIPEPTADDPEAPAGEAVGDDFVLEVRPVLSAENPSDAPKATPAGEAVGEDFVLEVRPVLSAETPSDAPKAPAEEAVGDDFVLEIKPVLFTAPPPEAAQPAAAPPGKARKNGSAKKRKRAASAERRRAGGKKPPERTEEAQAPAGPSEPPVDAV